MATKVETNEDESFIILDSSPGTSMERCNGDAAPLNKSQIEDAMKDLSMEASTALKAHFKLGDCPSPASMMVASTIITEEKSTDQLQKHFGEILDENVVLKETLKQNNDSMKEQFLLIASCQEDMMKTHMLHKEKFDETRELVEKLREENKKLKQDVAQLALTCANATVNGETGESKSAPSSALEFVTSPEDDTVDKLTAQLELVERQRRQVITDNENLIWQKESLEHMLDATTKERDDLRKKLEHVELQLSCNSSEYTIEIDHLKFYIQQLEDKLKLAMDSSSEKLEQKVASLQAELSASQRKVLNLENSKMGPSTEELSKRDEIIKQLEDKVSSLQNELKTSQLKVLEMENIKMVPSSIELSQRDEIIKQLEDKVSSLQNELKTSQLKVLEMENIKLEFSKYKSGMTEMMRINKENIQDLHKRLKEATTTVFQPVRISVPNEPESTPEHNGFKSNVKLYDRTLKHLSELLNKLTHGLSDSLMGTLGIILSLSDLRIERTTMEEFKQGLSTVKQQIETQHCNALTNIGLVRGTLSIFEGIFKDYKELIDKFEKHQNAAKPSTNVEALTAALVARGQELQAMEAELDRIRDSNEDRDLLRAQLDLYKSDFEAERESRQKMASEKDTALTDLRKTQKRNEELTQQLEEVRRLNPGLHRTVTSKRPVPSTPTRTAASASASTPAPAPAPPTDTVYTCPKCMRFSCTQYKVMEDHFDFCLDDF